METKVQSGNMVGQWILLHQAEAHAVLHPLPLYSKRQHVGWYKEWKAERRSDVSQLFAASVVGLDGIVREHRLRDTCRT